MPKSSNKQKRVPLLGNSHLTVFGFRKEIVERLVQDGYDVWVSFCNGPFGEGEKAAEEFKCHFIETHVDRRGTNPFKDLSLLIEYYHLIKKVKPDVVLAYTVKPDVYGGIICRILDVPYILNITGLGKGLVEGGVTSRVISYLYKFAVRNAKCVFFQNTSDKTFFDDKKIIYKKGIILPGSGVNLSDFTPLQYPEDDVVRFIYVARVMKTKGIEQYFEAAHTIRKEYPNTEFHICGFCEENYKAEIESRVASGEVIYHGLVSDVKSFEKNCHCVVLPTFHPEGVSNVLLEAASCARPIITTDRAGCRETVDNGITGYLVKERDVQDLIEKMRMFLKHTNSERKIMGLKGRKKIEKEFDRQLVVDEYLNQINTI